MSEGPEPLCFTCGLPISDPLRLNHLSNGSVCPSCRDRLLEALPAPFPFVAEPAAEIQEPIEASADAESWLEDPQTEFVRIRKRRPHLDDDQPA